jgi:hypothetical protein
MKIYGEKIRNNGQIFYLPPNAKIVKWTKNSNAKSKNLTLESTKSQWQTPPWLVEWLGSPPWLNAQIEPLKPLTDPLNPRPVKKIKMGEFFPSTREFLSSFSKNSPKTREFFPKTRQKLFKNSPEFFTKNSSKTRFLEKLVKLARTREFLLSFTTLIVLQH